MRTATSIEGPPKRVARKLKPGPGLPPEVVFADQRRRLRAATIELVAEVGYGRVTVRALSRQAGVSTHTFYRQFEDRTDCVGCACESTLLCALRRMEGASSPSSDWKVAINRATASLMDYFAANPEVASVALIEAFDAGPSVIGRLRAVSETYERFLAKLLRTSPDPIVTPHLLSRGMVAGLFRIVRATARTGRAAELPALADDLGDWMLALASPPLADLRRWSIPRSAAGARREADPFPHGHDAAPAGDDRDRIVRATLRLAVADGFDNLTIPRIRRVAEVSRRSFNAHFAGVSECFLASLDWLVRSAAARARAWAAGETDCGRRARRLVLALCAQAARNEALARLVLVGVQDPGREGLLRRDDMLDVAAGSMLNDMASPWPDGHLALRASMAGAWEIAAAEVAAGGAGRLPHLSPFLIHVLLASVSSRATAPGR